VSMSASVHVAEISSFGSVFHLQDTVNNFGERLESSSVCCDVVCQSRSSQNVPEDQ
jgi:hypothetical protein